MIIQTPVASSEEPDCARGVDKGLVRPGSWTGRSLRMAKKRRRHAPDARTRQPRYEPTIVEDIGALLVAVQFILGPGGRAETTKRTDECHWRKWKDHCAAVSKAYVLAAPIDPMVAPWWVFRELCLERREDGKPLSKGYVQHIAATLQLKYETRSDGGPTVAPYKLPEHTAEWRALLAGLARAEADRRINGDPPRRPVMPLPRAPMLQMLQSEPPRPPRQAIVLAMVLLAFDTELSAPRLQALEPEDVELLDSDDPLHRGGIRVAGVDHPLLCDHRERVRGVAWDCTACAVRTVLATHVGRGPLVGLAVEADCKNVEVCRYPGCTRDRVQRTAGFGPRPSYCQQSGPGTVPVHDHLTASAAWRQIRRSAGGAEPRQVAPDHGRPIVVNTLLVHRRKTVPYLQRSVGKRGGSALTPVHGLDDWQVAGLRRGLALGAGYEEHVGFCWVRARAWVATTWVAGFRMAADLSDLGRDQVEPAPTEADGYVIRLRGTKDDPPGAKRVIRALEWSATGGSSAAQAMAEYLCVRDAAVGGRDGALLLTSAMSRHRSLAVSPRKAANDLDLLCRFAGLPEGVYSSYSTRKGYGQQTRLDGWEPEQIQQGLRHQRLDTTRLYTGAIDERVAVSKLMDNEAPEDVE